MKTTTYQHRRIVEYQDAYTSEVRWYDDMQGNEVRYDQFDPMTELIIASTVQGPEFTLTRPRRVH